MFQRLQEKFGFATRRFASSMLFLHAVTFLFHATELIVNIADGKNEFNAGVLLQSFLNDVTFIFIAGSYIFIFYQLIYFASDFTARMLLAVALILTISIQIGLMQYYLISNMLLGADLWNYSWHDIKLTISASTSISWWQLLLFPILLGLFMRAHYAMQQYTFSFPISAGILGAYVLIGLINNKQDLIALQRVNDKSLALNKSAYFIEKTREYVHGNQVNSPYMQQELLASVGAYPFQAKQPETDRLGPYLTKPSNTPPNIVFVLVEGLGKTFVGPYADYAGCMPFLDSLSGKSLFWTNFLSTTGRTFGVLPSVLGSLPYGKGGFMEETNMPNHTSLIRLLKQNGYKTAFYYGGDAEFDGQRRFLTKQGIDHIYDEKSFSAEYQKIPTNSEGFSWGYGDDALFKNSLGYVAKEKQPYFSVYLTVTTHEPFVINNPERFDAQLNAYVKSKSGNKQVEANKNAFRTLMYADQSLRAFFEAYKKRPEYANTIFVITGDHRMIPVNHKNEIDRYHVPLFIFSPMLKTARTFKSVASHADLPSTFVAYLKHTYRLQMPDTVHWLGKGLTFETTFSSDKHLPIMRNKGQIADYVFGKYFITDGALQNLSDNMVQTQNRDEEITKKGMNFLEQFKRLNEYVCTNDKLYHYNFVPGAEVSEPAPEEEIEQSSSPQVASEEPTKLPKEEQKSLEEKKVIKSLPKETTPKADIPKQEIQVDSELRKAQDYVLRNPTDANGYYKLGLQHMKLGNLSWAKANLEKALALNYELKAAYTALIDLELQRKNKEMARWYYYKAIGVFDKQEFEAELNRIKSK